MQVQLTTLSSELYASALDQAFGHNLHPAYQDKPLSSVEVTFYRHYPEDIQLSIAKEELVISAFSYRQAEDADVIRGAPEEVKNYYRQLDRRIGSIVLTPGLVYSNVIPSNGVDTRYKATMFNGGRRAASSFDRNRKMTLASAIGFAEEAISFTASPDFVRSLAERCARYVTGDGDDPRFEMHFSKGVRHDVDLPINGHENSDFIASHYAMLRRKYTVTMQRLARLEGNDAPDLIVAPSRELLVRLEVALERIKKYL